MHTLPDPLRGHAQVTPERCALEVDGLQLTYAELDRRVTAVLPTTAHSIAAAHTVETVVDILAHLRAGFSPVLFDPSRPEPPAPTPEPHRPWSLDAVIATLFTSGSTGASKPVAIRLEQALFATFGSASRLGHLPDDRWLCPLPLFHVAGFAVLFRTLLLGTTAVFARDIAARLSSGDVSLASLVSIQLATLLRDPNAAVHPRVRAIVVGGGPLDDTLAETARARGFPLCRSYGASETAAMVACDVPGAAARTDIPLLPFVSAHVENGALVLAGPQVTGGRFASPDLGTASERHLTVTGRRDHIIICGGKKLSPERTEVALRRHPSIRSALCLPWPDPERWGTLLIAWIDADPGPALDAVLADLPREQRPRALVFGDIPQTALGKSTAADRQALLARLEQGFAARGWQPGSMEGRVLALSPAASQAARALSGKFPDFFYPETP